MISFHENTQYQPHRGLCNDQKSFIFRTTDSYIWCSTKWGNQPQSEYIEAFSKSFKGLETQINIWETFIVNSTNVNQDDAMLFP
ncbi:hypothetical protein ECZC10_52250 [Escherichia coli]|nr:hypothetical protein ECZC10_52250 [Escherichia coli]